MKHNIKIYKLHFTTPLHLSNEREDYAESLRTLHSDTIYAAITASLAKIGIIENDFQGDLGCTISSLFPFYQKDKDSEPVYFFPKSRKIEILDKSFDIHKLVKKVNWIDRIFFERHLNGETFEKEYADKKKDENGKEQSKYLKGSFLTAYNIPKDFITAQVFPHAQVPRQQIINDKKQDTEIYYMERLFFKDFSGMYFIAEGDTGLLEKGLNVLCHEGIGTDRNVGNGFFEWTKDNIELEMPENTIYAMNLSLFLPENEDQLKKMLDNNTAYSFKKRGGWITTNPYNTLRKNRVYMFEEGSVFKYRIDKMKKSGRIADLTPDLNEWPEEKKIKHRIYRNGESLFIPIKL